MLGSVGRLALEVGEADGVAESVGVVVEIVLELDALGLLSPPQPESSSIDAASDTAGSAAQVFLTVSPSVSSGVANRAAGMTTLGMSFGQPRKRGIPPTRSPPEVCRTRRPS